MFNMVPDDKFNCYPHVIASWNLKVLYSAPGLWSERNEHAKLQTFLYQISRCPIVWPAVTLITHADSAPSLKSITILSGEDLFSV